MPVGRAQDPSRKGSNSVNLGFYCDIPLGKKVPLPIFLRLTNRCFAAWEALGGGRIQEQRSLVESRPRPPAAGEGREGRGGLVASVAAAASAVSGLPQERLRHEGRQRPRRGRGDQHRGLRSAARGTGRHSAGFLPQRLRPPHGWPPRKPRCGPKLSRASAGGLAPAFPLVTRAARRQLWPSETGLGWERRGRWGGARGALPSSQRSCSESWFTTQRKWQETRDVTAGRPAARWPRLRAPCPDGGAAAQRPPLALRGHAGNAS